MGKAIKNGISSIPTSSKACNIHYKPTTKGEQLPEKLSEAPYSASLYGLKKDCPHHHFFPNWTYETQVTGGLIPLDKGFSSEPFAS